MFEIFERPMFQLNTAYTLTESTLLVSAVIIVIIAIIGGNLLVIIAVCRDKSMRNVQNWFIGKFLEFIAQPMPYSRSGPIPTHTPLPKVGQGPRFTKVSLFLF